MPISQYELHGIAVQCGFKIVQFSDHPDFFSSWSITINKGGRNYLIEHEGRDGWLMFYRENTPAKFEELDKKSRIQCLIKKKQISARHGWRP